MEYAFLRDVNDCKISVETFDGVEYWSVSLVSTVPRGPVSPVPIISFEMAQRSIVDTSIHYFTEVKDMSVIRSAVGIQALVVSVASVVLRRSFCVAGAGRWARCDAATMASLTLRRPATTAYAGQCIVQEKFLHT